MSILSLLLSIPMPDSIYRWGIRYQLMQRLKLARQYYKTNTLSQYASSLCDEPIAIATDKANAQHYEIPAEFFGYIMGKHRKYSCCYFESDTQSLDDAETAMLALTCERAAIQPKQRILELGCGWGSLTLYMAQQYPDSHITAISNSKSQGEYIRTVAASRSLTNITVLTDNIATLNLPAQMFDRIISVEMFEHVRNYKALFKRLATWLTDSGSVFIHVFGHKKWAYRFDDSQSWMAQYFFSGGQMPARHLFRQFNTDLKVTQDWSVNGTHYAQTCQHWLKNFDTNKPSIMPILQGLYGSQANRYFLYWRLFFMACDSLFAFNNGTEWLVYHYRLHKRLDCVA